MQADVIADACYSHSCIRSVSSLGFHSPRVDTGSLILILIFQVGWSEWKKVYNEVYDKQLTNFRFKRREVICDVEVEGDIYTPSTVCTFNDRFAIGLEERSLSSLDKEEKKVIADNVEVMVSANNRNYSKYYDIEGQKEKNLIRRLLGE